MTKHIVDKPADRSSDSRLERYTELDKREGQSKREKALHRQARPRDDAGRAKRYVDMDRRGD